MKHFNYKDVSKTIGWNFSQMKYSVIRSTDFDYYKEVVSHITPKTVLLDIGCGSAEKSTRYYSQAKKIYLTDFEPEMLNKAKKNVQKYYENNSDVKSKFKFQILDCNGPFNFADNTFDVVVSRHCGANMIEVYRVLKKNGIFISEDYNSTDCQELKDMFKKGQNYNQESLSKQIYLECINAGFNEIKLINFEEHEFYKTPNDLKFLLSNTPIINGFDEEKDLQIFNEYTKKYSSNKGIKLNRRLYAFILKK